MALYFTQRFRSAAQMFGQELLGNCVKVQAIFGPCETVAFVFVDDVFHILLGVAHGLHDLIALGLLDAWIIGALADQQWGLDLVYFEERRTGFQELLIFLRIADAEAVLVGGALVDDHIDGRVIDLSLRAAREIDMVRPGVAPVKLKVLKEGQAARTVYCVQVGAFENLRAAEVMKQQLEKKYPAVTVQSFAGETTIYRVRIGREPDIQAAQKLAGQLRKDDLKPFVVRVN